MFLHLKIDIKNYYKNNTIEYPSKWQVGPLKSFLIPMESTKISTDYFDYIDIDAIDNKRNVISAPKHINKENAPSRAGRKIHEGDVLFSIVRPYLRNIAIVPKKYEHCIASTGFYVCTPLNYVDSEFLFYLLISPYCINSVMPYMKGDNSPSIKGSNLENIIIGMPSPREQKRIVNKINNLYMLVRN